MTTSVDGPNMISRVLRAYADQSAPLPTDRQHQLWDWAARHDHDCALRLAHRGDLDASVTARMYAAGWPGLRAHLATRDSASLEEFQRWFAAAADPERSRGLELMLERPATAVTEARLCHAMTHTTSVDAIALVLMNNEYPDARRAAASRTGLTGALISGTEALQRSFAQHPDDRRCALTLCDHPQLVAAAVAAAGPDDIDAALAERLWSVAVDAPLAGEYDHDFTTHVATATLALELIGYLKDPRDRVEQLLAMVPGIPEGASRRAALAVVGEAAKHLRAVVGADSSAIGAEAELALSDAPPRSHRSVLALLARSPLVSDVTAGVIAHQHGAHPVVAAACRTRGRLSSAGAISLARHHSDERWLELAPDPSAALASYLDSSPTSTALRGAVAAHERGDSTRLDAVVLADDWYSSTRPAPFIDRAGQLLLDQVCDPNRAELLHQYGHGWSGSLGQLLEVADTAFG